MNLFLLGFPGDPPLTIEQVKEEIDSRIERIVGSDNSVGKLVAGLANMRRNLILRLLACGNNRLHNVSHTLDAHGRLCTLLEHLTPEAVKKLKMTPRKKVWMGETMLRHDDDHSGHKYRQDFMGGRDSNEEWSVKLFRDDASTYGVKITDIDFKNFSKGIYVTTFAQDEKFFDKEDLKYRDYGPKTIEDFFIVFADIGGAMMHGWDYWLEEGLRYMEEFGDFPSTLGEWIDGRKKFLRYQESIYDKISPFITESYRNTLEANLKICQDTLIHLESGKDTETLEKRIAIHPESIS